ncbi:hypothetical protein [Martelella endophytica]|uniref:Uncharacterized protein n=1 Tax=Martelella endophytica TaxID=1486262 RepID=A0A0D5LS93_MAREN|nr:hypothetical protein [Martelella endophytica]AJY47069.1 hypothetical protein TM49_17565 [Martelella endophytica]
MTGCTVCAVRLIERNKALSEHLGGREEFVAGYQKIKRIGRGSILGAAMAGTCFGLWLSERIIQALRVLNGG